MPNLISSSAAQVRLCIGKRKGKLQIMRFDVGEYFVFYDGSLVAVETGGAQYFHVVKPSSAITKALTSEGMVLHRFNCDAGQFDFIVGSMLTKAGLPLTRRVS